MKKKLVVIIISLLIVSGCNNNVQQKEYNLLDQFQILDSLIFYKIETFSPINNIRFYFDGSIKNGTDNIFRTAKVSLDISLHLDNGHVIGKDEIEPFSSPISGTNLIISNQWQPNEVKKIDLHTPYIEPAYTNYPIKSVYITISIKATDIIKQTTMEGVLLTYDITEKWLEAVKELKRSDRIDISDYKKVPYIFH